MFPLEPPAVVPGPALRGPLRLVFPLWGVWLLAAASFAAGCGPSVFLHPQRGLGPPPAGYRVGDLWVDTPDGVQLHGWELLPTGASALGTVVFFHGNAGNLGSHVGAVLWLVDAGYRVLALDYRGFGRSEGDADVAGAHTDAATFLAAALARRDLGPGKIAVLGQSFGGAVAIHAVATSPRKGRVGLLIADSAFAGYHRIVQEKAAACLCTWPLQGVIAGRHRELDRSFMPEQWAPRVAPVPLLVLHGDRDPVVPPAHGARLHAVAGDPKGFWRVEGAGHVRAFASPGLRAELLRELGTRLPDLGDLP